jgi:hypothetical protein
MRRHLPIVCFVLLLLVNLICAEPARKPLSAENWSKKLRDGDIVFIRSRNSNSQLIADLSSPSAPIDADNVFTHCGIIFKQGGTPKVYEGADEARYFPSHSGRYRRQTEACCTMCMFVDGVAEMS